jgi:YHS domain-containing protein
MLEENTMLITTKPYLENNLQHFDWRPTETLQRDKEQSNLLHEPKFRIMTTDPISGHDVDDYMSHCSLLDGNLTIYFDTEENCKEYKSMPFDHPNQHLPFPATDEDDRGG